MRCLAAIAAVLFLAACGGGTGGGTLPTLPGSSASGTTTDAGTTTEAESTEATPTEGTDTGAPTTETTVTATVTATEAAPATTEAAPAADPVADRRLARDGLVTRGDLPSGLGFKGITLPGASSRCFATPVRKLGPAGTASGRQFIGNRSRSVVSSLAWSFPDEDAASEALAAVATVEAIDCFGKQNARGSAPTLKYLGADTLDFPTVGDETVAYRGDYRAGGGDCRRRLRVRPHRPGADRGRVPESGRRTQAVDRQGGAGAGRRARPRRRVTRLRRRHVGWPSSSASRGMSQTTRSSRGPRTSADTWQRSAAIAFTAQYASG